MYSVTMDVRRWNQDCFYIVVFGLFQKWLDQRGPVLPTRHHPHHHLRHPQPADQADPQDRSLHEDNAEGEDKPLTSGQRILLLGGRHWVRLSQTHTHTHPNLTNNTILNHQKTRFSVKACYEQYLKLNIFCILVISYINFFSLLLCYYYW